MDDERLLPLDEAKRMAAVVRYDVLDTPPDGAFDRITALASRLLRVPISIVSIVDTDRIWFKSRHGIDVEQIDRDPGLCASAILQEGPWLVNDAAADPRTLANPLVSGDLGLRFYAGVPLTTQDGDRLGTLCVIDQRPRELTDDETATLEDLAALVMHELELRLAARTAVALESRLRTSAEEVATTLQESLLPPRLPVVLGLDIAARYHPASVDQVGGDFYDVIGSDFLDNVDECAVVLGEAAGTGPRAAALAGRVRWTVHTLTMRAWTPANALGELNNVLVRDQLNPESYCSLALAHVTGDGDLTLALGGHASPLVLRTDGTVETIGENAPAVGWLPDVDYIDTRTRLATGDVLVVFTDGVIRALSEGSTMDDAPLHALLGQLAGRSAEEVAAGLDEGIGRGLTDDAAFVVVRRI
jgi:sigma-B regulation protein RsbU (phosphoserine phosphatase)